MAFSSAHTAAQSDLMSTTRFQLLRTQGHVFSYSDTPLTILWRANTSSSFYFQITSYSLTCQDGGDAEAVLLWLHSEDWNLNNRSSRCGACSHLKIWFQVLAATRMEMAIFWDVAPYSLVDRPTDRRFRVSYCLHDPPFGQSEVPSAPIGSGALSVLTPILP
jgi:hypothetical protein